VKAKHHKHHNGTAARLPSRPADARPTAQSVDEPSPNGPSATLPPDQVPSPQKKPTLEMIRERAYFKWVEAGRPASDGKEFWEKAEAEINGMSGEWNATGEQVKQG
jgi:hypothetical protein